MSPSPNAVEIKNVRFRYTPTSEWVLSIRELAIARGDHVFIYGPSGSGKTTLLGLLAGVLEGQKQTNQSGESTLKLLNQDFLKMSHKARDAFRGSHIGYIFQMFNLIPYLSVKDNIALVTDLNSDRRDRIVNESNIASKIEELAMRLGIHSLLNRKVTELSVGQQQRVAAARALLGSPEIIIADEPTSALDHDHRAKFIELLFSEAKRANSTIIFVSHDRELQKLFPKSISLREVNEAASNQNPDYDPESSSRKNVKDMS